MSDARLGNLFAQHRALFADKPLLRRVYTEDFFPRLRNHCQPRGATVEIGAGPGLFKNFWPEVIATDVSPHAAAEVALDACRLPFRPQSVGNLVGIDVLHHLPRPLAFLEEAQNCLIPGGCLVLLEPWLTPFSRFVYRNFHHEECDESVDPFAADGPFGDSEKGKHPMEGNQALPSLLFSQRLAKTLAAIPRLKLMGLEPFGGAAYLLSLGFKTGSLAPGWAFPVLKALEQWTGRWWKPWAALRALIVLSKV